MPLPSDEKIVRLANDLLAQMDAIFGLHPGFRPVHAKGMMLSGAFTPSALHFGKIVLTAKAPVDEQHRRIIFDPIPRVDGTEPSDDPLLELRAAIYLLSGRRRRQAAESRVEVSRAV